MDIPTGFTPLFRTSPVLDLIGPIYCRGAGRDLALGLRAEAKHCNSRSAVHGGILATIADVALGYAMAFSSDPPVRLVTAHLSLDFAGSAKVGDWLETQVDIQRQGSRLSFANCYILVGDQRIVHASAVFLVAAQSDRPNAAQFQRTCIMEDFILQNFEAKNPELWTAAAAALFARAFEREITA